MNFLELKKQFESKLKNDFKFELLDLHYSPYSFGSGTAVYNIKGRVIKIIYDGRDSEMEVFSSKPHDKYPGAFCTKIFNGNPTEFIENVIVKLNSLYN